MKLVLYDKIYLQKDEINPMHLIDMNKEFTSGNPKYFYFKRSGRSTYGVDDKITMYETVGEWYAVPIGAFKELKNILDWNNYKYDILDKRVEGKPGAFLFDPDVSMDPHQEEALRYLHSAPNFTGTIQAPPGSGKTFLALKYISDVKKRALVIVHETKLLEQWMMEIERRGKGDFTAKAFYGQSHDFGDITVAVINSTYQFKDSYPEFNEFGLVIVDETHRAAGEMFAFVLNKLPAKRKFGLSGTLKRKDQMHFLTKYYIGPKLLEIPESAVKSRVTSFDVEFVKTGATFALPWNTRDGKPHYKTRIDKKTGAEIVERDFLRTDSTTLVQMLSGFKGKDTYPKNLTDDELIAIGLSGRHQIRNQVIVNKIVEDIKVGHTPIILAVRTMHAKFIYAYLKREGYTGVLLIGETKDDYDIEDIRAGHVSGEKFQFVSAIEKIAAEALDIPSLSCLHLLNPSTNEMKLKQCLGRIRRQFEGKLDPIVRDYVDSEEGILPTEEDYFEKSAKSRRKNYELWKKQYAEAGLF